MFPERCGQRAADLFSICAQSCTPAALHGQRPHFNVNNVNMFAGIVRLQEHEQRPPPVCRPCRHIQEEDTCDTLGQARATDGQEIHCKAQNCTRKLTIEECRSQMPDSPVLSLALQRSLELRLIFAMHLPSHVWCVSAQTFGLQAICKLRMGPRGVTSSNYPRLASIHQTEGLVSLRPKLDRE